MARDTQANKVYRNYRIINLPVLIFFSTVDINSNKGGYFFFGINGLGSVCVSKSRVCYARFNGMHAWYFKLTRKERPGRLLSRPSETQMNRAQACQVETSKLFSPGYKFPQQKPCSCFVIPRSVDSFWSRFCLS